MLDSRCLSPDNTDHLLLRLLFYSDVYVCDFTIDCLRYVLQACIKINDNLRYLLCDILHGSFIRFFRKCVRYGLFVGFEVKQTVKIRFLDFSAHR